MDKGSISSFLNIFIIANIKIAKSSVYAIVLKMVYPEKKVVCMISGRKVSTVGIISSRIMFHYYPVIHLFEDTF